MSGWGHHGECGAQAYNGGLGQSPQRDPGAEPLVGGQGGEVPLKLTAFWSLDVQRTPANLAPFQKCLPLQGMNGLFVGIA